MAMCNSQNFLGGKKEKAAQWKVEKKWIMEWTISGHPIKGLAPGIKEPLHDTSRPNKYSNSFLDF